MRRLKHLTLAFTAFTFMLITPVFTAPKLPTIPDISHSVTLPEGTNDAVGKAAAEAVKDLKITFTFKR